MAGGTRTEVIDLDGGIITIEADGVVESSRALTPDEVARYTPTERVAPVDERLAKLEAENAALRKALVKSAVITDAAIEAEKAAVEATEAVGIKR